MLGLAIRTTSPGILEYSTQAGGKNSYHGTKVDVMPTCPRLGRFNLALIGPFPIKI